MKYLINTFTGTVSEFIEQIDDAILGLTEYKLSDEQKDYILSDCPNCKTGHLHAVEGTDDENGNRIEDYLWCNTCDLSMDESGGYTC